MWSLSLKHPITSGICDERKWLFGMDKYLWNDGLKMKWLKIKGNIIVNYKYCEIECETQGRKKSIFLIYEIILKLSWFLDLDV